MKNIYLLAAGIILSSSAYAELGEEGLSGEVSVLTGYGSGKNNLSTENETAKQNSQAKSNSDLGFSALGQLRYTFGDDNDHQLYFGNARSDIIEGIFALELGYSFELADESVLSFGYLPTVIKGEVWEDPYKFTGKRKKSDISGNTYRFQYEYMFGSPISMDFAYYNQDIKNEKSASHLTSAQQKVMQRDGKGYYLSLSSELPISEESFFSPSVSYHNFDADGKAMSFDEYGLSLTYLRQFDQHAMSFNIDYAHKKFASLNPVFSKTQKDNSISVNMGYEYQEVFGWEDWGFNALVGYDKTNSNITFYDKSEYMVGVGLTYMF